MSFCRASRIDWKVKILKLKMNFLESKFSEKNLHYVYSTRSGFKAALSILDFFVVVLGFVLGLIRSLRAGTRILEIQDGGEVVQAAINSI